MKTYRLTFLRSAQKEWEKLGANVRTQFAKKLRERLSNPRILAAKLHELPDCYKIKLRAAGYRLIYRVYDDRIVVQVIAVGKRDKNDVYELAQSRFKSE